MPNPLKIVILGANGQIGSEVALYLSMQPNVQVIGMVRAAYGAVLLKLAGIPWYVFDCSQVSPEARTALFEADAVVDCTFPSGQQQELLPLIERNATCVMSLMRRDACFVHSSSISAFGVPKSSPHLKNYRIARTAYARTKRLAEKRIRAIGRDYSVRTYNLRLGQIHGVLQAVTRQLLNVIPRGSVAVMGSPDDLCNVAFAHSVAEAYKHAAQGSLDDRGTHTVVTSPQWQLSDLYETYKQLAQQDIDIRYNDVSARPRGNWRSGLVRLGMPFRGLLESWVLPVFPAMMPRLKGEFRMHSVLRDRRAMSGGADCEPIYNLIGKVPGPIVGDTRSSVQESIIAYRQIESRLNAVLQNGVEASC